MSFTIIAGLASVFLPLFLDEELCSGFTGFEIFAGFFTALFAEAFAGLEGLDSFAAFVAVFFSGGDFFAGFEDFFLILAEAGFFFFSGFFALAGLFAERDAEGFFAMDSEIEHGVGNHRS
ncbi:MAG: hypothetical protein SH856_04085 [Flavobacteriales bacterium]|nr:hypothetical protein [Flavobacteriales bacterium]